MAYTQTDLDSITAAITALAIGQRRARTTIAGNTVEYAPVDLPALRALRDEVAAAVTPRSNPFVLVSTSKGV